MLSPMAGERKNGAKGDICHTQSSLDMEKQKIQHVKPFRVLQPKLPELIDCIAELNEEGSIGFALSVTVGKTKILRGAVKQLGLG